MSSDALTIGLDAGGTKTDLLARRGTQETTLTGPGAHVLRDGSDAAASILASLIREASGDDTPSSICIGATGAGREPGRSALEQALAGQLDSGTALRVVHDAEIALHAAWGDASGAVLIVGTGSLLYARDHDGSTTRAGGWGWRVGDDASGTALGRATLRLALAAHDGGPPTAVSELLAEEEGLESSADLLHAIYETERPLASFAPALLTCAAAGDWMAEQALVRETNALGQQAGWLATRLGETVETRLALVGGLLRNNTYRASILSALERHLPGWTLDPDPAPPVAGALRMAQALLPE